MRPRTTTPSSQVALAGAPVAGGDATVARYSTWQLFWLNLYWFANNLHWGALLAIAIPSQVEKLLGHKELNFPLVVAGGTLAALVVHPLAGALSDRTTARLGRRRPWLLWATIPNLAGLFALAVAPSVGTMALAFLVVQAANNAANAPWSASIADLVPAEQRGAASGWCGLLTVLGTVAGSLLAGAIVDKQAPLAVYRAHLLLLYGLIALVQLVAVLLTVWLVREQPRRVARPYTWRDLARTYWVNPRSSPDFFWVCLTRLLVQLGIASVFFYLQYYFEDVLGLPGERTVGTVFLPLVMVASLLTVYGAGSLSDRIGRKRLVYASGALMSLVCLGFILVQRPAAVPIAALLFGVGYGAYTSVDWALACDALPTTEDYGRDMGLWAAAGILPQLVGIVLGGLTLAFFKRFPDHLGYTLLFVLTLGWFTLGTVLLARVKRIR